MGVKSTYTIQRDVALQIYIERNNINLPSDEELEDFLERQPESTFRNYIIVDNINVMDCNSIITKQEF